MGPNPENLFSLRFTTAGELLLNNDLLYPSSSTTQDQEMQNVDQPKKMCENIKSFSFSLLSDKTGSFHGQNFLCTKC